MKHLSADDYAKKRGITKEQVDLEKERLEERLRVWQLKEARKSQNITQKQLAATMDVSQKRISDLENGDITKVQIETLRRYVHGLHGSLHIHVTLPENKTVNLI